MTFHTYTTEVNEVAESKTTTGSGKLSDEDQAAAAEIRIPSFEQELREAHGNPIYDGTEEDGKPVAVNIRDVTERYAEARAERFRASKAA